MPVRGPARSIWMPVLAQAAMMFAACADRTPVTVLDECGDRACFTRYYFGGDHLPGGSEPCGTPERTETPALTLEVSLFRGPGIGDREVAAFASRLQRFYAPYRVLFWTEGPARPVPFTHALSGTRTQLEGALARAQVPAPAQGTLSPADQARSHRALGEIIFADLRAFVADRARARTINFLLLRHVLTPELREYLFGSATGPTLFGFGMSPALFARTGAGEPERGLHEMSGLRGDFPPLLVVGTGDLGGLRGSVDNLLGHELGHALGLPHVQTHGNVMTPGPSRDCQEPLSASQRAEIAANAAASSHRFKGKVAATRAH